MGYLTSQVKSIRGWSVFDDRSIYENEEAFQPEFQKIVKNQSLPYIPTKIKSEEIMRANLMERIELKDHQNN